MCIEYDSINRKLSISEMAQIHNITRQTLIYYDKIGLFKPDIIESNGYRYYSTTQIPLLREICFLRSIGMSLDDIRKNNTSGNSTTTIALLESQNDKLQKEIDQLRAQQNRSAAGSVFTAMPPHSAEPNTNLRSSISRSGQCSITNGNPANTAAAICITR